MTSLKQIEANLLNALKRNGPRTELGKQRSRQNALRLPRDNQGETGATIWVRMRRGWTDGARA
jgi:hypothetical protein